MIWILLFFFLVAATLLGAACYCYHEVQRWEDDEHATHYEWMDSGIFTRRQAD